MKKIIFILISFFIPIIVNASSVNYEITDFLIDAKIQNDGSMKVDELIVLDGNFNGYIRELEYKNPKLNDYIPGEINFANSAIYNASSITEVSVSSKKITEDEVDFSILNEIFTPFTRGINDKLAQNGNYILKKDGDILSYKMYRQAEEEQIAFKISYTINDVIVMHEDIAELYWTFIGSNFTDKISNLQIRVSVPEKPEYFRFWAHGDITGEINQIEENVILAEMKTLDKNTTIDIRMLFDKTMITNDITLKKSEETAIAKVLEIETKRAEDANKKREIIRLVRKIMTNFTNIYYIFIIALWIWVYIKFDREHKSNFNSKYYREFTGEYNVEVIDYLMKRSITPNAMSASIMNLIYKKNIEVEEITSENKNKKKYRFHLKNNTGVTDTEQILLDFLFEKVGKENSFTTSDLEKYAKSSRTCQSFTKNYTDWKNCVIKDAEREKFYETNGIPTVLGILELLFSILITLVVMYYQIDYLPCYFLLPIGTVFLFYTILIKKRTKKGHEDYLKWKAFKNFLNDFGAFKIKELPEIALWEKYLVYATVFGLADKVKESMNIKITEYEEYFGQTIYTNWNPLFDWHIYHVINESVNTSFRSNMVANSANANSRNSSGSGFGGGFSSGSGFGGGGGGGRGF